MKNKAPLLLAMVLSIHSYFPSAQMQFSEADHWYLDQTSTRRHTEKIITLPNGVQLQYAEQGNATGVPVIFLHGYTDSWHSFESTLPFLPSTIHAFAISQRGHGNSSRPENHYHPKDFAADIAAFMKEKGLETAFVVGHSMGGIIAQQFAVTYPQLIKGLVILGSAASFKNNPGMPEFYNEVLKLTDPIPYEFAEGFQRSTLVKPIDSAYYSVLVGESMKVPARVWHTVMHGIMSIDYRKDLSGINKPALIIWGDKDTICSRQDQDTLVKGIKNARLFIYEGTGHALHWEEPQRFANDLNEFINSATGAL